METPRYHKAAMVTVGRIDDELLALRNRIDHLDGIRTPIAATMNGKNTLGVTHDGTSWVVNIPPYSLDNFYGDNILAPYGTTYWERPEEAMTFLFEQMPLDYERIERTISKAAS